MPLRHRIEQACAIMQRFAARTGLAGAAAPPRRYLWTDAYAVCNFLELGRLTGEPGWEELARRLVDQVHQVLGQHREDDGRHGWLSGLDDRKGAEHPTRGGLRIGKRLPERRPEEPFDEQLEWERDGQYYHYLTKWMVALNRLARRTATPLFHRWAIELAKSAHNSFTYLPPGRNTPRMHWKMSVDLSRPLVPGMGHHDPLDGLLTLLELQADAGKEGGAEDLPPAIRELAAMCRNQDWLTDDPLGLGGILGDGLRAARLLAAVPTLPLGDLLADLLAAGARGLSLNGATGAWQQPADSRLPFRELGLAIGLHGTQRLEALLHQRPDLPGLPPATPSHLQEILRHAPLGEEIEEFWLRPENQRTATWRDHLDINAVMLATSLVPDGYFGSPANE